MKFGIAIIAVNGSEDIEVITPLDLWTRAGFDVFIINANREDNLNHNKGAVRLKSGLLIESSGLLSEVNLEEFQAFFVAGGAIHQELDFQPGEKTLPDYLKNFYHFISFTLDEEKFWLLAICAAPALLIEMGVIPSYFHVTAYPGLLEKITLPLSPENDSAISVVQKNNVLTGNGPGAAYEFALEFIKLINGVEAADEIAASTQYKHWN